MYEEYEQHHFTVEGHEGILICPQTPREDRRYIWRTEFLGAFDFADRELLKRGWYLAYYRISDQFGAPAAVGKMRKFQAYLEEHFNLAAKAVLFGFSRGGLYAVNYAAAYPEKTAKLYLDAPVLDIFSWPGGFGRGEGSPADWKLCREFYQVKDGEKEACENPLNKIQGLIAHRIPVLLVAGDADTVVPFRENGQLLYAEYTYAGGPVKLILKPGVGHHPHSLEEPAEIVDWVELDEEFGCILEKGARDWQIFQQKEDGFGEISLTGRCVNLFDDKPYHAFVRVVNEADGLPVVDWMRCEACENNRWRVALKVPRGGLYRIDTCMDLADSCSDWSIRGDCVCHLGVGDVFVIAGQSNSAGYGKDFISDEPEPGVHLLKNNGRWDLASHPMNDSTGTLHPQNRDYANTGHSPYLSFAKYLRRELGYPIGLMQTALGGSPLESWSGEDGSLYRNFIHTVEALNGVKGVLWYQGCSDTDPAACRTYGERFEKMVRDMRRALDSPGLPFLTCQLHKVMSRCGEETNRGWGMVREAQRRAAQTIPGVFVISTLGGGMSDGIHNAASANLVIGERLARCALRHLYGRNVMSDSPDLLRAVKDGPAKVRLEFQNVYRNLEWMSEWAQDKIFCLEGEGKRFLPAAVRITGADTAELEFAEELPGGCVVHGAYEADLPYLPMTDSASRLPMLSFYGVCVKEEQRG